MAGFTIALDDGADLELWDIGQIGFGRKRGGVALPFAHGASDPGARVREIAVAIAARASALAAKCIIDSRRLLWLSSKI